MTSPIPETDRQSLSIVVLGDFNPAIFQPLWFSANGLMPREETESAANVIIHRRVASFSMGRIHVQVDESRLGLTTAESPDAPILRDLAIGTLSILEHTPLKALGFNLDRAIELDSVEATREFAETIAPKQCWSRVLDDPEALQVIVMGTRSDCVADRMQIRVQLGSERRVIIGINQHYQVAKDEDVDPRECHNSAQRALRDDWNEFIAYASDAAVKLMQTERTTE